MIQALPEIRLSREVLHKKCSALSFKSKDQFKASFDKFELSKSKEQILNFKDNSIIKETIQQRIINPELKKAIMGALIYLDDTQIRNRPGKLDSKYDSSSGDGNKSTIEIKFPFMKSPISMHVPGMQTKNEIGGWAGYIYLSNLLFGRKNGKLPFGIQDSNAFVTAFVDYPLYLFNEKSLPDNQQVIKKINKMAIVNSNGFKRNDAYNFWRKKTSRTGLFQITSPSNISTDLIGFVTKHMFKQPLKFLASPMMKLMDPMILKWTQTVNDSTNNPYGNEAFLNIPEDADDTSVITANQKLYSKHYGNFSNNSKFISPDSFQVDINALSKLEQFRDINRVKKCDMDSWKGDNTGAFLTWLKDENRNTFTEPQTGVIPSEVNLVDEVVNANAVFSMSLNGLNEGEGYKSACKLISESISKKHWQTGSIFYTQKMIFPYCATRAFRDGGANNPVMRDAMKKLLIDLLDTQKEFIKNNPDKLGAFPGGVDTTTALSTALGVISLLNIGKNLADEVGVSTEYDKSIVNGVSYLLKNSIPHKVRNNNTFNIDNNELSNNRKGIKWEPGLFFVGDPQSSVQWWSEAYTTSMVLEALAKYVMAYDKGGVNILEGRRINIQKYSKDAENAAEEFKLTVS